MASQTQAAVTRRQFVGSLTVTASVLASPRMIFGADAKKYRAAIIGHTKHGDYGHGLDVLFNGRENIEVVAVADPDADGRAKAKERCRALRDYADYRELVAKERPQLVSVAMRWTDRHHAICKAALEAGAHIFVEKPFTTTLAEADDLLAIAKSKRLKIAVAHQMRLAPAIQLLKQRLSEGLIGDLLQIRAHGKQDARAGGEDMLVLGTHLFDLMRLLAGDPAWCTAQIRHQGREATRADARKAAENIGPILGDEIEAQFAFPNGVHGSFTSRGRNRQTAGHWGIEIAGSSGALRILADIVPRIFVRRGVEWSDAGGKTEWERFQVPTPGKDGTGAANARLVDDWLGAIESDREPTCSGEAGMKAIEMVMAVYQAGLIGARVSLPLKDRRHPLQTDVAL
ncbi:MAG: Gfo/Idh/MocA family oxidoreductase [Verrucomicrobia subdivision 3 bacterium]|nr:Gfo/Idh/MocA family oxidoreductase [Limisphaerales bacterium]